MVLLLLQIPTFFTRCEGAGTNNSLRERRHEHVVRLDEEELPTAAFIFMKVTILEELRVFGIVAVAPLVEHVDAWTLGPLPTKQTLVPYSSDVYCSRFEEPRVRRVFVLWRAFAFIARTRFLRHRGGVSLSGSGNDHRMSAVSRTATLWC